VSEEPWGHREDAAAASRLTEGDGLVSDFLNAESEETPTVEVRVFRDAQLVHRELCESDEQAGLVVEAWSDVEGTEFEVDDLSTHHGPEDILDLEAPEPWENDTYRAEEAGAADRSS
jgi:hypothetical protein